MSLKNQSLAYTTSLKIKQELIENTDQHPVATKTDIDLMPAAKASKSILDHQSTSSSPISINSSPNATTLSAPIKSPKVSVPLELKTTSSTEVESSPKSAEYKTVSSVETVLPKTPIKENRPSADLLASASHMSQSTVYSKTPKSCCSVKRPRSPSENQAGRVSSNASSKRSVPKVAHGKSSITTSRDHKTSVTKKTPKRVSPKTPSRPAPVKTPKSPSTKLTMTPKSVVGTPPRTASSSKTNFNKSNQSFANEPRSENIQSQAEVRKTRSRTPSSDLSMPLLVSAQTPTSTKKSRSDVTPRYS